MKNLTMAVSIPLIMLGTVLAPQLSADVANQLTYMTFSGPVEIPGQVLPAGTYVFRVLDFNDPNVVQILSKDQNKVYATILAIPDSRMKPTGKTVITFEERAANAPPAVKAWFYPGDSYGHEFVYPKARAIELAKLTKEPVPSMPENLEANTKTAVKSINEPSVLALRKAQLKAEQPSGEEEEVVQVFTPPPSSAQTQVAQNQAPSAPANKLPSTGSDLPLVAFLGMILAGSGFTLHLAAEKLN